MQAKVVDAYTTRQDLGFGAQSEVEGSCPARRPLHFLVLVLGAEEQVTALDSTKAATTRDVLLHT